MPQDVGYKIATLENGEKVAFPGDLDDGSIQSYIQRLGQALGKAVPSGAETPSATNLPDAMSNLATGASIMSAGAGIPGLVRGGGTIMQLIRGGLSAAPRSAAPAATQAARAGMSTTGASGTYVPPPNSIGSLISSSGSAAPPAAAASKVAAQEVAEKIIEWRTRHKFSGPQIVSALKEVYGYSSKEANEAARAVIAAIK